MCLEIRGGKTMLYRRMRRDLREEEERERERTEYGKSGRRSAGP